MSILHDPPDVMLFTAFLYAKSADIDRCIENLVTELGDIEISSSIFDFSYSDYYEIEMGSDLLRKIVCFKNLISRDKIVEIKILTNNIEDEFRKEKKRTINIDPGYLSAEHIILATGKGFSHRPYLGKGVYADIALLYEGKRFKELEWTYPDYRDDNFKNFFYECRDRYLNKLRKGKAI